MSIITGKFISLRGDVVARINEAYPALWNYNLERFAANQPKLNRSPLPERSGYEAQHPQQYRQSIRQTPLDLPQIQYGRKRERATGGMASSYGKRGLYLLYKHFVNHPTFDDEEAFRKKEASAYTGVPTVTFGKRIRDFITILSLKIKDKCIY